MIILANDGISQNSKKELIDLNFKIFDTKIDQSELIKYINRNHIEIILVRSATIINSEILNNCKSIKLIGRAGVGLDNIDLISAKQNNIKAIQPKYGFVRYIQRTIIGIIAILIIVRIFDIFISILCR